MVYLRLHCPAGFSYLDNNLVKAYLVGPAKTVDVTEEVAGLRNAQCEAEGIEEVVQTQTIEGDTYIIANYGESFTLEDFATAFEDLYQMEIQVIDGPTTEEGN